MMDALKHTLKCGGAEFCDLIWGCMYMKLAMLLTMRLFGVFV
jgi:hypothetical protein